MGAMVAYNPEIYVDPSYAGDVAVSTVTTHFTCTNSTGKPVCESETIVKEWSPFTLGTGTQKAKSARIFKTMSMARTRTACKATLSVVASQT